MQLLNGQIHLSDFIVDFDYLLCKDEPQFELIYRLIKTLEYKDKYSGLHLKRVASYVTLFAEKCKLDKETVEKLKYASLLHDIGKVAIPDVILRKPGPLTDEEFEIIKFHTIKGELLLRDSNLELLRFASQIALYHHEKIDGSGYPFGLKGEDIPIYARFLAVADVFDALTTDRPYRKALKVEEALEIIKKGRGLHFDSDIVECFLSCEKELVEIKNYYDNL